MSPVLVAGSGIGGLSAAIALARRGFAVKVLEAEAAFSEAGAGLQIGPNGTRILRSWGLGEALGGRAAHPAGIRIRDGLSGRSLAEIPLGAAAERRYGAPYWVAERRVLHGLLLGEAMRRPGIELATGFRLAELRQDGERVVAVAADGREQDGAVLIGADGVHSRTRSQLFGAAPHFSGRNAWRAMAAPDDARLADDDFVNLWLGPDAHLVHYRCGARGPVNAVAVTTGPAASAGWGTRGEGSALGAFFEGWAAEPREILASFRDWMIWPLLAMPHLPQWTAGRATLLGDAAHPLMPFLASGAVMAIEDAAALAAAMARTPEDPAAAFRAYEVRRMDRAGRVQQASARMGEIYHMTGALRLARNLTLAAIPGSTLLARNDWLYGYRADDQDGG